jgi:hypothetical protein
MKFDQSRSCTKKHSARRYSKDQLIKVARSHGITYSGKKYATLCSQLRSASKSGGWSKGKARHGGSKRRGSKRRSKGSKRRGSKRRSKGSKRRASKKGGRKHLTYSSFAPYAGRYTSAYRAPDNNNTSDLIAEGVYPRTFANNAVGGFGTPVALAHESPNYGKVGSLFQNTPGAEASNYGLLFNNSAAKTRWT